MHLSVHPCARTNESSVGLGSDWSAYFGLHVAMREEHEGHVLFAIRVLVPFRHGEELLFVGMVIEGVQVE